MKIVQIKRKVTGFNYSNLELTAEVDSEQESITEKMLELDRECKRLLEAIQQEDNKESELKHEKYKALNRLEKLKNYIESGDIKDLKDLEELPF